jgi:hypothetical protein
MNGWQNVRPDPGRCCLGRGVVSVGKGALNQRSAPIYRPEFVIGAWPDGIELLVWDVTLSLDPTGEWLYVQPASGPLEPICWSHSSGIVMVVG